MGPDLPIRLYGAGSVTYEGALILSGGYSYDLDSMSDGFFKFDPLTLTWSELPMKLKMARKAHVALLVSEEDFPCN